MYREQNKTFASFPLPLASEAKASVIYQNFRIITELVRFTEDGNYLFTENKAQNIVKMRKILDL